jgi:ADP-ribosylglycohydrolase
MKRNKEYYRGCLFGGAVGDAFGSAMVRQASLI